MPVIELAGPPLTDTIARFRFDPLGYVSFAFPWGEAGSSLAGESGPEPWQRDVLDKLGKGLMVPDDYGYDGSDAILLERKDDMKKRELASPDDGDALALTFAYPVAKRDWAAERRFEESLTRLRRWVV